MIKIEKISKLFNLEKGSAKYTKKYGKTNAGSFPVYSSQTTNSGMVFHIDSYDYDNDNYNRCITWTSDGAKAGTVFIRDNKFSMTTHCGAIFLKEEYKNTIDIDYIYFYLKSNLHKYAIGEDNKRVTKDKMASVEVPIPYINDSMIDYSKQLKLSKKQLKIEKIKNNIKSLNNKFASYDVDLVFDEFAFEKKTLDEIFDFTFASNSSLFTRKVVNNNKGAIPCYGASTDPNEVGYGYIADNLKGVKYYENCLTINRNGSVGYVHYRKNKFTLSMDVTPLILKSELKEKYSYEYLMYVINQNVKFYNFGFGKKAGKNRIKRIEIDVPIDSSGDINLESQKVIAEKYHTITRIKKTIISKMESLYKNEINLVKD